MVLKVSDKAIRDKIEKITDEDEQKGSIRFQRDINGDWVVDKSVLTDPDFESVHSLLIENGQEIEFVGLPEAR